MSKAPENTVTTATAEGVTQDPGANLTPAQIEALDRDGDGQAGGSKPLKVGEVVKKGKAAPTAAELGSNPAQPVLVRIPGKGDGRVHDGQGGRYDAGDEVVLPLGVARNLQGDPADKKARGYVEIIGKA